MKRNGDQPMSDINITPLTDVMLVLLIIFMISSPVLLARGMEVHLPQVPQPQQLTQQDHVLYMTIDGKFNLDGKILDRNELSQGFADLVKTAGEKFEAVNLFIKADKDVTYGDMTGIMDMATSAGIEKLSLVQDILSNPPATSETPGTEQPPAEQPSTEQPPAEQPSTEQPPAGSDSSGTG